MIYQKKLYFRFSHHMLLFFMICFSWSLTSSVLIYKATEYGQVDTRREAKIKEICGSCESFDDYQDRPRELFDRVRKSTNLLSFPLVVKFAESIRDKLYNGRELTEYDTPEACKLDNNELDFIRFNLTPEIAGRALKHKVLPDWLKIGLNSQGKKFQIVNYNEEFVKGICPQKHGETDRHYNKRIEELMHVLSFHLDSYYYVEQDKKIDLNKYKKELSFLRLEDYVRYALQDECHNKFFNAYKEKDTTKLRSALKSGATPNYKKRKEEDFVFEDVRPLLIQAATSGDEDSVKALLEYGADPQISDRFYFQEEKDWIFGRIKNNIDCTPLYFAVKRGHINIVELLLPHIRLKDFDRYELFNIAIRQNNLDMVKLLYNQSVDAYVEVSQHCKPLVLAAISECPQIVEFILKNMTNSAVITHVIEPKIIMFDDVMRGVSSESDIRNKSSSKYANVIFTNELEASSSTNSLSLSDACLTPKYYRSFSHLPPNNEQPYPEEDAQDEHGYTSFMWAIEYQRADLVKLLIQNGSSLDVQNNNGETALDIAQRIGNKEVLDVLYERVALEQTMVV